MSEIVEDTKEMSLATLDSRESELTVLAESAKGITITGPEDKSGYKLVREKRIELKNARISVQNDGKDLRENAVKFQKTVIAREKQLIAIIAEEENRLSNIEDEYDRWLEEARIKREREENDRIQKRVDTLMEFNYAIDLYEAKTMPEEDFENLLKHAETEWRKEQEMLESKRVEDERLKREEEERIQQEKEELARQRAEQDAREKELQRQESERIEAIRKQEEAAQKENERIRREQDEREAKLREEREAFEAEKRKAEEEKRLEQAKKEAAERARIEEQERIEREAREKAEREQREKEEAQRQEALRPDKDKLIDLAKRIMLIEQPELKTKEAIALLREASDNLISTAEYIRDKSHKL